MYNISLQLPEKLLNELLVKYNYVHFILYAYHPDLMEEAPFHCVRHIDEQIPEVTSYYQIPHHMHKINAYKNMTLKYLYEVINQ